MEKLKKIRSIFKVFKRSKASRVAKELEKDEEEIFELIAELPSVPLRIPAILVTKDVLIENNSEPPSDEVLIKLEDASITEDAETVPLLLPNEPVDGEPECSEKECTSTYSELNPLLLHSVLDILFEYLSVSDLKTARLVNHQWNFSAATCFQRKVAVRFRPRMTPKSEEERAKFDPCTKDLYFFEYTRKYVTKNLNLYSGTDNFLFKDFSFAHPPLFIKEHLYHRCLSALLQYVPHHVQSLQFIDTIYYVPTMEELEKRNITYQDLKFVHPKNWERVFFGFVNLQKLELIHMSRKKTQNCISSLERLLDRGVSFRISTLAIIPPPVNEKDRTPEVHSNYVDLIKSVVSKLPLDHFTFTSECSAEELKSIVFSRRRDLKVLIIQRFLFIHGNIYDSQSQEGILFDDISFPCLEKLEVTTLYFEDIVTLMKACPRLKHLILVMQPTYPFTFSQDFQQVTHPTPVFVAWFIQDPERYFTDNIHPVESIVWRIDDSLLRDETVVTKKRMSDIQFYVSAYMLYSFRHLSIFSGNPSTYCFFQEQCYISPEEPDGLTIKPEFLPLQLPCPFIV